MFVSGRAGKRQQRLRAGIWSSLTPHSFTHIFLLVERFDSPRWARHQELLFALSLVLPQRLGRYIESLSQCAQCRIRPSRRSAHNLAVPFSHSCMQQYFHVVCRQTLSASRFSPLRGCRPFDESTSAHWLRPCKRTQCGPRNFVYFDLPI